MIKFDVLTAQQYTREGKLEDWIHAYLNTGYWANRGLSEGLSRQRRWWIGPIEMELADLARACGPEEGMEYRIDAAHWAERTLQMAQSITDPLAVPPLIVEYRQGNLSVRDGNTRHEAMRSKGWPTCWVLIWYNTEQDYHGHAEQLVKSGKLTRLASLDDAQV
jgi:hypothetical protein